jgi:hypothetical protein
MCSSRAGSRAPVSATLSALLRIGATCVFIGALLSQSPAYETLDRTTYANVRGINYVAVYYSMQSSLNGTPTPPGSGDPTGTYNGSASPLAMWYYYDPSATTGSEVSTQLEWARKTGFNSVRVFLSYPLWRYYNCDRGLTGNNNPFNIRLKDFINRCFQKGLYVMPVLWDSFSINNPQYGSNVASAANLGRWHESPGHSTYVYQSGGQTVPCGSRPSSASDCSATCLLNSSNTLTGTPAETYIHECIDAFGQHPGTILLWDVANEPESGDAEFETIVKETMRIVHQYGSTPALQTATFSHGVSDAVPQYEGFAFDTNCDLIGLHPYAHTRLALESYVYEAQHIIYLSNPMFAKPLICTEMGFPGIGQSYADTVAYCRYGHQTPPGTTGITCGVGYMPWAMMIGSSSNDDHLPYKQGCGIFYGGGTIRSASEAFAFVDHATAQYPTLASYYWTLNQLQSMVISASSSDYIPQEPVGLTLDDYAEYMAILDPGQRGTTLSSASWQDYVKYSSILSALSRTMNFGDLSSPDNGNVFVTNPFEPWVVTWPRRANCQLLAEWFSPGYDATAANAWNNDTKPIIELIFGMPPGSFQPEATNSPHLALMQFLLNYWADLLYPIISGRGGPYTSCTHN